MLDESKGRLKRLLTIAPFFSGAMFCTAVLAASEETGDASANPVSFWQLISLPAFSTYFSTFTFAAFAWIAIVAAKNRERKHHTFVMLCENNRDPELDKAFAIVKALHEDQNAEVKHYAHNNKHSDEEAVYIRYLLNHYENICIGMKMGAYDEDVVFSAERTIIIHAYTQCESYIKELRAQTGVKTSYIELEALVQRWEDKRLNIADSHKWQHKWAFWK